MKEGGGTLGSEEEERGEGGRVRYWDDHREHNASRRLVGIQAPDFLHNLPEASTPSKICICELVAEGRLGAARPHWKP